MNEQQKKTILTEELMYIKKELGLDKDQKQLVIKSYQEKYEELRKELKRIEKRVYDTESGDSGSDVGQVGERMAV